MKLRPTAGELLLLTLGLGLGLFPPPPVSSAQTPSERDQILWKNTLTIAAKGTRIALPSAILAQVRAKPSDCLKPSPQEAVKLEAYEKRIRSYALVTVRGRGTCFCSPTGNCAFWLFRLGNGKKDLLLATEMVQDFGFLPSTTKGLPDLVLWSHDSAERFPAALWKFNGTEYFDECGWEVVSTFRDVPNGIAQWVESHIENNTCETKVFPMRETAPNSSSSRHERFKL